MIMYKTQQMVAVFRNGTKFYL